MPHDTGYILSAPESIFPSLYGIHQWGCYSSGFFFFFLDLTKAEQQTAIRGNGNGSVDIYLLDLPPTGLQLQANYCPNPKHSCCQPLVLTQFISVFQPGSPKCFLRARSVRRGLLLLAFASPKPLHSPLYFLHPDWLYLFSSPSSKPPQTARLVCAGTLTDSHMMIESNWIMKSVLFSLTVFFIFKAFPTTIQYYLKLYIFIYSNVWLIRVLFSE